MLENKLKFEKKKYDTKEFELPETHFIRDIDDKVFQSIVLHCLSEIEGISLVEGNFIDHLFGRSSEGVKGIEAEQDDKNQSIRVKVEVNILYGLSIPEVAEKIQSQIAESVTHLTGLHVSSVHVVFKNVVSLEQLHKLGQHQSSQVHQHPIETNLEDEYTDEF